MATSASRVVVLKPGEVAVTRYFPGGRSSRRKKPVLELFTERVSFVAIFVAVIVAFWIAAPVRSCTVPLISPVIFWATAGTVKATRRHRLGVHRRMVLLCISPPRTCHRQLVRKSNY